MDDRRKGYLHAKNYCCYCRLLLFSISGVVLNSSKQVYVQLPQNLWRPVIVFFSACIFCVVLTDCLWDGIVCPAV